EIAMHRATHARRAGPADPADPIDWPAVAVVLPVLDEARFVGDRLRDFARTDYPADRLELWVVDGGSRDGTTERVEAAAAADPRIRLLRLERSRSKSEQLRLALEKVRAPVAVVSDADVALAPDAVRELARGLAADPSTAILGAHVTPATPLLEERLHWWWLDRLWWLEGELLGAAGVAAPCYALRPEAVVEPLPHDVTADDVHLGLLAQARGWRVRRSRTARARELRVPRTAAELLRYRRRRGGGFVHEVRAFLGRRGAAPRFRALVALRYAQLRLAPLLALTLVAAAPWTGASGVALLAGLGLASAALALGAARGADAFAADRRPAWRLPAAALRLAAANAFALIVPAHGRPASRGRP
ncbi:MAG TPA: glycosyltransferase, partial [Myxococcota bacterium]|nr:glycosyltransferase [Myxococcota bacterium]